MTAIDRRQVLRIGVLAATMLGTSTGVARFATARSAADDDGSFAEAYRGRRIRGTGARPGVPPRVFIDDVELHLMRLDTGAYTSHLNHFQSFGSPLHVARAAVGSLVPAAPVASAASAAARISSRKPGTLALARSSISSHGSTWGPTVRVR